MDDVYSKKKAFLEGQVRRLATALGPSRVYKSAAALPSVEDQDRLSDTMVENAIYKCIFPLFSDDSESCNEKASPSSVQCTGDTARVDTVGRVVSIEYQHRPGDRNSRRRKCYASRHSFWPCGLGRSKVTLYRSY